MTAAMTDAMTAPTTDAMTAPTIDAVFLTAVDEGREPRDHVANLRLAWLLLGRDEQAAERELFVALDRRALATGGRVHCTRTWAWLAVVRAARAAMPGSIGFAQLLAARPELLDRRLLDRYYDPATLADPRSAVTVVAPDRCALPDGRGWLLAG
jgi:hypothetical protein